MNQSLDLELPQVCQNRNYQLARKYKKLNKNQRFNQSFRWLKFKAKHMMKMHKKMPFKKH